jgi:L-threonylcarbamoyladenylate synthase
MSSWAIKQAVRAIQRGGVIAYPTEAVYGLGCNPYDAQAVIRLLQIKQRDPSQGLILIGRQLSDFTDFIKPLDDEVKAKVMASWPGPYTWLLPASDACPFWLRGRHGSIAVRITAHPVCRELCRQSGLALVSTSANKHGHRPALNALQVRQRLGEELDYVLVGHTSGNRQPSEIRDALTDRRIR